MALKRTVTGECWQRESRGPAVSRQPFVLLSPEPPAFVALLSTSRELHPACLPLRRTPFSAISCSPWSCYFIFFCHRLSPHIPCQENIQKAQRNHSEPPLSHSSSLRGERYIGMWQADQRHGPGVVVTQAGVCYQGTFQGDKMAVSDSPCLGHSVADSKLNWVGDMGGPAVTDFSKS